jgi:anti-anti-sigma regulatory factor
MITVDDIRRRIILIDTGNVTACGSACGQNLVQVLEDTASLAVRLRNAVERVAGLKNLWRNCAFVIRAA